MTPNPLLLLPLRLEYRVVARDLPLATPVVAATGAALAAGAPRPNGDPRPGAVAGVTRTGLAIARRKVRGREIWFRWYPDEAFSERGIAPATEQETRALARFAEEVQTSGQAWHELATPALADAWEQLVRELGFARALHLQRNPGATSAAEWADRVGRIVDPPRRFELFAVTGGGVKALGVGRDLPAEDPAHALRYTPSALAAGADPSETRPGSAGWITDFPRAVEFGMGLKLTDAAKVRLALAADWIVCVGVREPSQDAQLERFLSDAIANGNLEILRQDAATNSSHDVTAAFRVEPRDPVAALAHASFAERRAADEAPSDADRLATALGVEAAPLYGAPGAGLREMDAAAHMMRALLPALLDVLCKWFPRNLDRDALCDFLIENTSARGTIPALRVGRNAYGLLPVIPLDVARPARSASPQQQRAFAFASDLGRMALENSVPRVANVPVIQPGDPETTQKIETILRLGPVGHRVDVNQLGLDVEAARRIGCPYVETQQHQPADYLDALARRPVAELPDPSEADTSTPLLYRLIRLSVGLLCAALPGPLAAGSLHAALAAPSLDAGTRGRLTAFVGALEALRNRSGAQLETLMIEVLDLLHYRGDAWLSALAQHHLSAHRSAAPHGVQVGYYGFLGRLRSTSTTGGGDGYIQAPSVAHATTAALLRSAARRFGSASVFQLDLSSARVRAALDMLEALRAGLSLRQALGTRGERYLHEEKADGAIFELRDHYALPQVGGQPADRVPFDGLALIEKQGPDGLQLSTALRAAVERMKGALRAQLDAFSDLVIAEAVHQLAGGSAEGAGAWVRVLSGDPIPGQPEVVRTPRTGQAITHRVAVVLDPRPVDSDNPRAIAEPALARLAARALPGFDDAAILLNAKATSLTTGVEVERAMQLRLRDDLGLEPIDLVVGGESELVVRARSAMLQALARNEAFLVECQATAPADRTTVLRERTAVKVDLSDGASATAALLESAGRIRKLLRATRALAPDDVDAARLASARDDDALRLQVRAGLEVLVARCRAIADRADVLRAAVVAAGADLGQRVRALADVPAGADATVRQVAEAALATAHRALDDQLRVVARYGLPQALRLVTDHELVAAPQSFAEHVAALVARLDATRDALRALAGAVSADTPRGELNAVVERARRALRGACDGDALPVWPPFPKGAAVPSLQGPTAVLPEDIVGWGLLRPQLDLLAKWFATEAGARVWRVIDERRPFDASDDLDPPNRPDEERPSSRHDAAFVGLENGVLAGDSTVRDFAGFVLDEWSEFQPSALQHAALALNYDAPQSEPPHALLLGVPTSDAPWSPRVAAGLVRDTIRMMQMRALPSREAAFSQFAGRWLSVIPPKGTQRRIPIRTRPMHERPHFPVTIARVAGRPRANRTAGALDERRRPGDEP